MIFISDLIGAGGFLGSVLRYWTSVNAYKVFGEKFPYGTFVVNALGCLLIGFIAEIFENRFLVSPEIRIFLMIGFLGGYTTFSTVSLCEVVLPASHSCMMTSDPHNRHGISIDVLAL